MSSTAAAAAHRDVVFPAATGHILCLVVKADVAYGLAMQIKPLHLQQVG